MIFGVIFLNFVWSGIIIVSFLFAALSGRLENTLGAGLSGATASVEVLLSFAGIMAFWSGILKVCEDSGASAKMEKLLSPVVKKLFPSTHAKNHITMNIIANIFGTGNAATPAGIAAMQKMDKENDGSLYPSHEMSRFAIMNTSSLQLIPTTVIGLLASFGAKNPFSIVPYILISSVLSLVAALLAEQFLCGGRRKK